MPAGGLDTLTLVIFVATFFVFATLATLLSATIGGEQRRWRRRLRRAAGRHAQLLEDRQAEQFRRSVRKSATARRPLSARLLAKITPGYGRLEAKVARSGLSVSTPAYAGGMYAATAGLFLVLPLIFNMPILITALISPAAGIVLPYAFLHYRAYSRTEQLLKQLPEALDLMARGLKSGLPIMESVQAVGDDFQDPARSYFKLVHDKAQLGQSLEDALWDVAADLQLPEFNFFAISVSIQRETGGNLTENLANLSTILRRRSNMKMKVKALSSEARASAYILTSLPFAIAALITFVNPDYMTTLYQDPRGIMMMAAGLISIGLGVAVMVKMVNFEI